MKKIYDFVFSTLVYLASASAIVFLAGIIYSVFSQGWPSLTEVGFGQFFLSSEWHPTNEANPQYGILAMIVGSLAVTALALIIALPLGVGTAIYISEMANHRIKEILKPVIELLSAIPSVIYGLVGLTFISPLLIKYFHLDFGTNLFNSGLILGIMVIPIISSMAEDALSAVPSALREASYALGANKLETIMRVVLPTARSGITASVILGFGRAVGETMVVLMVAGGSATMPKSLFASVRPLTATIASEMGETPIGSIHYHALFGIAIVLFFITLFTNMLMEYILYRGRKI